jgi:signal transduction histidine kinase
MRAPALPLPPLIRTLRASAGAPGEETAERLRADLGRLAEHLSLAGIRMELRDVEPLGSMDAAWGSLAGGATAPPSPDYELRSTDGARLGTMWADGDTAAAEEAARSVEAAVESARSQLLAERAHEHLAALDAALRGISGALTVDAVLQLIVDRVRILGEAEYAALGIVGDDGVIRQFITSGIDPTDRQRIGAIPRGLGLLGLLIHESQSIRIPDIMADPRRYGFPPNHPEMHTFLGVPITVRGRSAGNLYLANKLARPEFSAADQELVERFALHAGIAIENARLAQQVQQLVVIEERERIGADLHDGVIQRIYGVNLSLDEVPEIVASQPDEAARRVEHAIEALNATIAEIREYIYILRPPGDQVGLVPSLHALAAEVRLQTGLPVDVAADAVPQLRAAQIRELVSIVREALSNVARHAGATRADVTIETLHGSLQVAVADNGIGFDAQARPAEGHQGLVNMRRRAERLGGTLDVAARPGAGTRIIVTLPTERS